MDRQLSFSESEFANKKRVTRREKFLARMETVVPWKQLLETLQPFYPTGKRGRPPVGLERMLRMYFLQQWYGLSDEGLEDATYDSQAMRCFLGIDLMKDSVPDATTLLNFRHLLEEKGLCKEIFQTINAHLEEQGMLMKEGTLVDATIINAPPSTKNRSKQRDPEMHQTKKGNQWYFGMKAHIGVDEESKLVHTVVATAANVSDISQTEKLLHGEEKRVHADAGYVGVEKREEIKQLDREMDWKIAARRKPILSMEDTEQRDHLLEVEKRKASVRAFVEHPFHIIKNLFGHRKTRYRGLDKNSQQLFTLFGLANLVVASRALAS